MHTVEDQMETIHLYVVRQQPKKPYTLLPLLCAFLCLLGIAAITFYSAGHPYYEHQRLTVPAVALPPQVFTAQVRIIPTGVKTFPATAAHGTLTITNGSVLAQTLPAGFIILSNSGIQVATDTAVFVPAGNANNFGRATVAAHLALPGTNLPTLAVDQVLGTSLYIRNLQPFTGDRPAYSVKFVTAQDKHTALLHARDILMSKSSGLHSPCIENHFVGASNMVVTWHCRFVQRPRIDIPNARITGIRLLGKKLIVDVMFVALPQRYWAK